MFIRGGKLNIKYFFITVALSFIIGGGIYGWQYLLPKIEVKIPEVGFSSDYLRDTASYTYWPWQLYKNEKYNYEINAPPDWRVYEKKNDCTVLTDRTSDNDPYYDYTYFMCVFPANNLSLREYVERRKKACLDYALGSVSCRIFEEKPIKVGNMDAFRMILGESDNFQIVVHDFNIQTIILKDNLIFELMEIYNPDYPHKILNKALYEIEYIHLEIYETILSTFRFLE